MGTCQPCVAFLAGFWLSRFLRGEGMGGMAAITLVLNCVATFAKSLFQRVGESNILGVSCDSFPGYGVSAFLELIKFLSVTLSTGFWFNRRFLWLGLLMALMTGDAIYPLLSMFAIDPGLKDSPCLLLVAGQTIANLIFCPSDLKSEKEGDGNG
jgi:hypothetical protein